MRNLRSVATAGVQDGESGDVAEKGALRRPLDEAIERILAGAGLFEAGGQRLPWTARVAAGRASSVSSRVFLSHERMMPEERNGRRHCSAYRVGVLPDPTPRLRFRQMTQADLSDIATLQIGGSRGPSGWIEWTQRNYEEHGFGLWVIETHAGDFVGDCGLTMQEVEGEWFVEAGWHVRSHLQRKGYASEAAAAVRSAAAAAGIEHLVAIIRPTNIASQRVATSIGLTLEREVHKNGGPALVFGAYLRSDELRQIQ